MRGHNGSEMSLPEGPNFTSSHLKVQSIDYDHFIRWVPVSMLFRPSVHLKSRSPFSLFLWSWRNDGCVVALPKRRLAWNLIFWPSLWCFRLSFAGKIKWGKLSLFAAMFDTISLSSYYATKVDSYYSRSIYFSPTPCIANLHLLSQTIDRRVTLGWVGPLTAWEKRDLATSNHHQARSAHPTFV